MNIDIWLFVATTCFALIGFLANLIVIVVAWAVKRQVAAMDASIQALTVSDKSLATGITRLERELAAHKLHVAETYARQSDIRSIFDAIKELRGALMEEIRAYATEINSRIDYHHPPSGQ